MLNKIRSYVAKNTSYLKSKLLIKQLSNKKVSNNKSEIRLFCIVKNEVLRLPFFLEYYRSLGVKSFFIMDNDSSDGTKELLLSQPDVHLFHTKESYINQLNWRIFLLNNFGKGHWCITVDADELFIFANQENMSLERVISYMDDNGYTCMKALWIDLYSNKPINSTDYQSGENFLDKSSYFDKHSLREGPNTRVFKWRTEFDKTPLVKYQKGLFIDKGFHRVNGKVKYSESTCAVFHFNFFSDFIGKVEREAERAVYFQGGAKYKKYLEVLNKTPDVTLFYEDSIKYLNSLQLVDLGLIKVCKQYPEK